MNGDSKDDGIRGIQYDFPGTKTIYLEYEKVCDIPFVRKKMLFCEKLLFGPYVGINNF